MERLALTPAIDHDMIHTTAIPDHRIFQVTCWEAGHIRVYAAPLKLVRAQDTVRADHNRAGPRHDLKAAVRANHHAHIRHSAVPGFEPVGIDLDRAELLPRPIQRLGNKHIARSRLARDHRITLVRENQRRHIVPFAALVVRPGKTLVYVRPDGLVADRVHGGRARPSTMAPALIPATGKHMIFADRKSTRLNSSHLGISYAVFCLKKK